MYNYKCNHMNHTGYEHLFNTQDDNIKDELRQLMENMKIFVTNNNEKLYVYNPSSSERILYKSEAGIINSFIDRNDELDNSYKDFYPVDFLFNNRLMPLDNSKPVDYDKQLKVSSLGYKELNKDELANIPYIMNVLLFTDDVIQIIHSSEEKLNNFIGIILKLLPSAKARKIGFASNLGSVPLEYYEALKNIRIYGLASANDKVINQNRINPELMCIDLTKPYDSYTRELNDYATALTYGISSVENLFKVNKDLLKLFNPFGELDEKRIRITLPEIIFHQDKNLENAIDLIKLYEENDYYIDEDIFKEVIETIISNNALDEDIENALNRIINKCPKLEGIRPTLERKQVYNLLANLNGVVKKDLDTIVSYFLMMPNDIDKIRGLVDNKSRPSYFILKELYLKSDRRKKDDNDKSYDEIKNLFIDFMDIAKVGNPDLNGLSLNKYGCIALFKYDAEEFRVIAPIYLLSSYQSYDNPNSIERRELFLASFKERFKDNLEGIVGNLLYINNEIKAKLNLSEEEASKFEIYSKREIEELICLYSNPRDYYYLLGMASSNSLAGYNSLAELAIDVANDPDCYKKYIDSTNIKSFIKFYEVTGLTPNKEALRIIDDLKPKDLIIKDIEEYRLSFIMDQYKNQSQKYKRKTLDKLHIRQTKGCDDLVNQAVVGNTNRFKGYIEPKEASKEIAINAMNDKSNIFYNGTSFKVNDLVLASISGILMSLLGVLIVFIPTIVRLILVPKELSYIISTIPIYLPFILVYAGIIYITMIFRNTKRIKNNLNQALRETLLDMTMLVYLPAMLYAVTYLILYFM